MDMGFIGPSLRTIPRSMKNRSERWKNPITEIDQLGDHRDVVVVAGKSLELSRVEEIQKEKVANKIPQTRLISAWADIADWEDEVEVHAPDEYATSIHE